MLTPPVTAPHAEAPSEGVNDSSRGQVAIIVAAWRASATIGRAVASALAQPETAEVVVVDDASNDGGATLAAARAADDGSGRLKIIALETNGGPSRARNAAIAASRAPWIGVLDSDDFLEPGRLAALLALAHKGYDLIADDLMQTPAGKPPSAGQPLWFRSDRNPIDVDFAFFLDNNLPRLDRHRSELSFLKPLMSRAFLERHGLRYDETMRLGEDYDLYARALALGGRMRLIPWAGYVSVTRPDSLSAVHSRADLCGLEAADLRLLGSEHVKAVYVRRIQKHLFTTRSRIVWIDFMDALKGGELIRALSIVMKDPRQTPHVLRGLWLTLARRFTGEKKTG